MEKDIRSLFPYVMLCPGGQCIPIASVEHRKQASLYLGLCAEAYLPQAWVNPTFAVLGSMPRIIQSFALFQTFVLARSCFG